MIRAVVFDLGGVLVRIHHTWEAAARSVGVSGGAHLGRLASYAPLSDYQGGTLSESAYLATLAKDLGCSIEEADRVHAAILGSDYPGAQQLVLELKAKGLPTLCLSNTNELHYKEFFGGRFPVCNALDHLIASHRIGANKPAAEAFQAIQDLLPPREGEVIFFDDHPGNVAGAVEFGWLAKQIDPGDETGADPVAQMRDYLLEQGVRISVC
jgi:putative hydrolase of the HAD superfamily